LAAPGEVGPASWAQTSTQEGYEGSSTIETKVSSAARFGCDFRIDARSEGGTLEENPGWREVPFPLGSVVLVRGVVVVGAVVVVADSDEPVAKEDVALTGLSLVALTIPYAIPPSKRTANATDRTGTV